MYYKNCEIIFLPGLLSDGYVWKDQVEILKMFYPIKVIPLTFSSSPDGLVAHVLTRLPKRYILIGHSLGGWIALDIARRIPNKIETLILLNTHARKETKENKEFRRLLIKQAKREKFEKVILPILSDYLPKNVSKNKELAERLKIMFIRMGKEIFIKQQNAIIKKPSYLEELNKIKCPTLIIHSDEDKLVNWEMQKEMKAKLPNSTIRTIQKSGHFSMLDRSAVVSRLIHLWLKSGQKINFEVEKFDSVNPS